MTVSADQLDIVLYPALVLRKKAEPVADFDDNLRAIVERMYELMREAQGVGLAAPQVGLSMRLFVANPTGEPEDNRVYINPKLVTPSKVTEAREEGCLSLPHVTGEITRPASITIQATDLDGNDFEETADGLRARVWQHEFDHLNGVLIIDKMAMVDRMANKKLIREMERAAK